MSLDITLRALNNSVAETLNITHNLARMAQDLGVYKIVWCPDELGYEVKAADMIGPLTDAIIGLDIDRSRFVEYESKTGWGTIDQMVTFLTNYVEACSNHPTASIEICK